MDWILLQKLQDRQALLWLVPLASCWKDPGFFLGFSRLAQWNVHSGPHVPQPQVVAASPTKS